MDKINLLSINLCGELIKAVDLCFLNTPVVAVLPVLLEFPDLFDVGAVLPGRAGNLIWPFGFCQAVPKIDQNLVGNMHFERTYCRRLRFCRRLRLSHCNGGDQQQDGNEKHPTQRGCPSCSLEPGFHHGFTLLTCGRRAAESPYVLVGPCWETVFWIVLAVTQRTRQQAREGDYLECTLAH